MLNAFEEICFGKRWVAINDRLCETLAAVDNVETGDFVFGAFVHGSLSVDQGHKGNEEAHLKGELHLGNLVAVVTAIFEKGFSKRHKGSTVPPSYVCRVQ